MQIKSRKELEQMSITGLEDYLDKSYEHNRIVRAILTLKESEVK